MSQFDVTEVELTKFKELLNRYFDHDDKIKLLQARMKEEKEDRDKLKPFIIGFMEEKGLEVINTPKGRLSCRTSYVKKSPSHKIVKGKLESELSKVIVDEGMRKLVIERIYEAGDKEKRVSLSRSG